MKELALVAVVIAALAALGLSTFKVERQCATTTEQVQIGGPFEQGAERSRTSCGWRVVRR